MTWKILTSLAAGVLCGLVLQVQNGELLGLVSDLVLAALLFTVGFSLGEDRDLWKKVKGLPRISLAVPFLVALGSIFRGRVRRPALQHRTRRGGSGWRGVWLVFPLGSTHRPELRPYFGHLGPAHQHLPGDPGHPAHSHRG